jgi:hypothetical protein
LYVGFTCPQVARSDRRRLASFSGSYYPKVPGQAQQGAEQMKRLAFVLGVVALGFAAAGPARADFSVIKFENGYCQIWWAGATPFGTGWSKVATAPDFMAGCKALDDAVAKKTCM